MTPRPRPGRPSRLTPAVIERFAFALSTWHHVDTAAALAGVARSSTYDWRRKGDRFADQIESGALDRGALTAHERRCVDFAEATRVALAQAEAAGVAAIWAAATQPSVETREVEKVVGVDKETNEPIWIRETTTITKPPTWQPAAWLLERRFPEEWGSKVQGIGEDGALPIDVRIKSVVEAVERHKGLRALPQLGEDDD